MSNISKIAEQIQHPRLLLDGIRQSLVERGEEPKYPLITLPDFSRKIWGLPRKGLLVIGARSSMGKSSLVLQVAQDIAGQNKPVLLLSLEMDVASLVERLFCQRMMIDNFELLTGKLPVYNAEWVVFEEWLKKIPLLITCGIGKTFEEVNYLIANLDPKPNIVIVDYIQGIRQIENERERINEYVRNFRQLMLDNNMLGILCSQINRRILEQETKEPVLENLKSTGVLEEQADQVWLLFYQWFYTRNDNDKNKIKLILAKNRNGRTGEYNLVFLPEYYLFREEPKIDQAQQVATMFGGEVI